VRIEPTVRLYRAIDLLSLIDHRVAAPLKSRWNKSKVDLVRGPTATSSAIESPLRCVVQKSLTSIGDSKSTLPLRKYVRLEDTNFFSRKKIAGRSILPSPLYRYQMACYFLTFVRKRNFPFSNCLFRDLEINMWLCTPIDILILLFIHS